MARFWLGVVLAAAGLSGLWLGGLERQLGVATPGSRWVFDAYEHKLAAANRVAGSRVLVVAGSNALFGIDSGQLEAFWGRPVVNLGVNAGLGLPYILAVSQRVARAGDVVLLPMEYALLLDDGSPNAQVIDFVVARDVGYWRGLPVAEQLAFAWGMPAQRWLQGLQRLPDRPVTDGLYGAHHLDARGDQTHSAASDQSDANRAAVAGAKSWRYGERSGKEPGGWAQMAAYAAWARAHGVCLIAVPTVLLRHDAYAQDAQEAAFYASVPQRVEAAGIAYVGRPEDFMYPQAWFFDTDHHLQAWARTRHTARLVALLKPDPQRFCKKM